MSDVLLHVAIGVLATTLLAFAFARLLWARAVRLTTRRLEYRIPSTISEIIAAQDMIRAEHAVTVRGLERSLSALRARMVHAETSAADLDAERLELTRELQAKNALVSSLEDRVRKLDTALRETATARDQNADARDAALRARDQLRAQFEEENANLSEARIELHAQHLRLIAIQTENENLKAERANARKEIGELKRKIETLQENLASERARLENTIATLRTELVSAGLDGERKAAEMAKTQTALKQTEQRLEVAHEDVRKLKEQLAAARSDLDAAADYGEREVERAQRLASELEDAQRSIQLLKARLSDSEIERERLVRTTEEAVAARLSATEQTTREKRRADRYLKELQTLENSGKASGVSIDREKKRAELAIAQAEAERDKAIAAERRASEQVRTLTQQLASAQAKSGKVEDMTRIQNEKARLEAQLAQLRAEWSRREQQLKRNAEGMAMRAVSGENVSLVARLDTLADEIALFAGVELPPPGKDVVTPLPPRTEKGTATDSTLPQQREAAGAAG